MSLHPTKATAEHFGIPAHRLKKGWRDGLYPAVEIKNGPRRELRWDWEALAPILANEQEEQPGMPEQPQNPVPVLPDKKIWRGSVWYLENPGNDNVGDPKPYRAVVVVSAQHIADNAEHVTVCLMTTKPKRPYGFHVELSENETGRESTICCEKLMTVHKSRLANYVCQLSKADILRLDMALACALGMEHQKEDSKTILEERDMYRKLYMQAMNAWGDKVRGLA